jgi:acetyl esterase/lipase
MGKWPYRVLEEGSHTEGEKQMSCRNRNRIFPACCMSVLLFVFLAFPVFHLTPHAHATSSYPVQVSTDISYGPQPYEVLDQCLPVGGPKPRPGIIMIHGGGWVGGDKSHYEQLCMNYAAQGYVAATINYRLAPQYQWPDQIGDVQLAVRYLRVNASSLDLDPTRICALGDSAGAHLALLLDELQTIHSADVASLYSHTSPTVQCVVDQFGPTDLSELYEENPSVQQNIYDLLDYQVPPAPIYSDASPIDNIDAKMGPALIIQGTQDQTVLPDQSQGLYQALQNDGISAQYISYDGGHEYSGLTLSQIDAIMAQINNFLNAIELP